ncbi:MAG TPA: hypothetical protein VGT05_05125 [Patescibacteria group bacterium]|nr:hypothetical protein [Patescibacteria group bacterium]
MGNDLYALRLDPLAITKQAGFSPEVLENETIRQAKKFSDFLDSLRSAATDYIQTSLVPLLPGIPEEKLYLVLQYQNYTGTLPISDLYDDLVAVVSLQEHLVRCFLRSCFEKQQYVFDFSPLEQTVIYHSLILGDSFDELYRLWHYHIIRSPLEVSFGNMGYEKTIAYLRKHSINLQTLGQYQYVLFFKEGEHITMQTYAQVFPHQMNQIDSTLIMLLGKLREMHDQTYYPYFDSLQKALSSTNPSEQEALFSRVDETWMGIQGRLQPVHMMESYVDPLGLRVEPEYALAFADDRFEQVNKTIMRTKDALLAYLTKTYHSKQSLSVALPSLRASVAGIYTMLRSGRRLDFRLAGQNVPNREHIRFTKGVKIFLDIMTMHQRWEIGRRNLEKLLGKEVVEKVFFDHETIINLLASTFTAGHEFSHNAFVTEQTRELIGSEEYKDIEENKADFAAISAAPAYLSSEEQLLLVKGLLAVAIRIISYKDDVSQRPYYYAESFLLELIHQAKLLYKTRKNHWLFDPTPKKIQTLFALVQKHFTDLVTIYDTKSQRKAREFMRRNYQVTSFQKEIIAILEKKIV